MFKREHHLRIATVLQSLCAEKLHALRCYFGGGTAMVLLRQEYRESVDIDFLISDMDKYRELRQEIKKTNDLTYILRQGQVLHHSKEIRADQYGIRTMLEVGGVEIKFEIVLEGRIRLSEPQPQDSICGVPSLTLIDMATSKLLANSDRWSDRSTFRRDLIDLAMLDLPLKELRTAMEKAEAAYGLSVARDLEKSIQDLKNRPGALGDCMSMLKMTLPEAVVWDKIRKLNRLISKG